MPPNGGRRPLRTRISACFTPPRAHDKGPGAVIRYLCRAVGRYPPPWPLLDHDHETWEPLYHGIGARQTSEFPDHTNSGRLAPATNPVSLARPCTPAPFVAVQARHVKSREAVRHGGEGQGTGESRCMRKAQYVQGRRRNVSNVGEPCPCSSPYHGHCVRALCRQTDTEEVGNRQLVGVGLEHSAWDVTARGTVRLATAV